MYQPRDDIEARLIKALVQGNIAARRSYATWLVERDETARAAFLHLDRAILHAPWQASLDGGWLDTLGIEWLRALGHEALQLSTWDMAVPPGQSVQILAPASCAQPFWPQHLLIAAAGTPRGAADWAIRDLRIGHFSQFYQSGDVTGDIFTTPEIDRYVSFKKHPILPATEVSLIVSYTGAAEAGLPFCAWLVGDHRGNP